MRHRHTASFRAGVAAVLATALAAVAACGDTGTAGSQAADEPADEDTGDDVVTITFESYNYGTDGVGGEGTQRLIDEFEAAHPNIRIEPTGTPAGEIHTSVHAQAAAGNPPDVAQIGWSKFGFVLENLPYVPLGEVAPVDELQAHLDGMYPAAVELGMHEDALAGLAYSVSTPTMFINADLFAEAGLDPQDPPSTWAEAEDAALAIADETGAQGIYVDAAGEAKSDFLTQSLINSNGGRLVGDDGSLHLDDPAAVEALSMLGDLTGSGAQPAVGEAEAIAIFESGQLGMLVSSTALLGGFASSTEGVFELETAGLPAFDGHDVAPTVSGAGLFVFADDPDKQAAAWDFVRFLTGDDGFTILASVIGYLPLRPSLIDDPAYLGDFFAEDDRLLPTIEQLDSLVPYQVLPGENSQQAVEFIQDNAVAPIMISGADAESTLADVAQRARELLGQ
ncbi:ABC transporter substrate-binding protein [Phytoactinopolyspora halotolerans]|uniref:ABC transporter substrate-binding protein n=1 Tax=Phytoactinopolyspora halotolerans TaxID=1981512 RepID=A0A6L9SCU6_9ACTN|nr:ABC transporter substrate-binding protein [Phytoactinopolyspora halotolerans]NEE02829.1 ABC transporter substrate-binding protein [Phytoactinopolyspora halotolerans]